MSSHDNSIVKGYRYSKKHVFARHRHRSGKQNMPAEEGYYSIEPVDYAFCTLNRYLTATCFDFQKLADNQYNHQLKLVIWRAILMSHTHIRITLRETSQGQGYISQAWRASYKIKPSPQKPPSNRICDLTMIQENYGIPTCSARSRRWVRRPMQRNIRMAHLWESWRPDRL